MLLELLQPQYVHTRPPPPTLLSHKLPLHLSPFFFPPPLQVPAFRAANIHRALLHTHYIYIIMFLVNFNVLYSLKGVKVAKNSLSRALRPPRATVKRRAPGPAAIITATPWSSSAGIPIILIARETARGVALLGLHLIRGFIDKSTSKGYVTIQHISQKEMVQLSSSRNANGSYSCGLPVQTGSQSGARKPIYDPGCEEHLLHPGHLQTCWIVKDF